MLTDREIFMALVDGDSVKPSDAIILLEGDGLNRYQHAVELYKSSLSPLIVFSGGITDYNYGSFPFHEIKPLILEQGVPEADLYYESVSLNTKQQADEIIRLCIERNWERIILVASHYHQYRAYLTFLNSMYKSSHNILIYNSPVKELSWFSPNVWGNRLDCLKAEFERINKYMQQGDLASYEAAIEYQQWKEQQ